MAQQRAQLFIFFTILCLSFAYAQAAADKALQNAKTDEQLEAIYDKANWTIKHDLGRQCRFQTLEEAEADAAKHADVDSHLSYDEFMAKVRANGLLDESQFNNPDSSDPEYAEKSIKAILDWTNEYIRRGIVGKKQTCFMNAKEVFAMFYYTGEGYRSLNRAIRAAADEKLKKNERALALKVREKFAVIGQHLSSGLDKIKGYDGYVKRGQSFDQNKKALEALEEQYEKGNIIEWSAYTSTSVAEGFDGEAKFIIRTLPGGQSACRYVADFSLVEQKDSSGFSQAEEEEVLCKPYTSFRVLFHKTTGYRHEILMEELPYGTKE
jgi:hypothetical protein